MLSRAPPRLRAKTIFSSCYPPIFPWVTTESFLADRPGGVSAKFGTSASPAGFVRTFLRIAELTVIERGKRLAGRPLAGTDPIPLWERQTPVLVAYYVQIIQPVFRRCAFHLHDYSNDFSRDPPHDLVRRLLGGAAVYQTSPGRPRIY